MKNKSIDRKHTATAWETWFEFRTPLPDPPYHVDARNANEFSQGSTSHLRIIKATEKLTDMPSMRGSTALNDPQDVRPERVETKEQELLYGDGTPSKQKERENGNIEKRRESAHFIYAYTSGA